MESKEKIIRRVADEYGPGNAMRTAKSGVTPDILATSANRVKEIIHDRLKEKRESVSKCLETLK